VLFGKLTASKMAVEPVLMGSAVATLNRMVGIVCEPVLSWNKFTWVKLPPNVTA